MKKIAARLRHHADLAARTGAELGGGITGFHAEFLHILQARLQAKAGGRFAVQIPPRGIDDGRPFDTIKPQSIFLVRAPAETDVIKASATRGLGARNEQIKLRKLAPVQREGRYLPFVDVAADTGRAGVHYNQLPARNV